MDCWGKSKEELREIPAWRAGAGVFSWGRKNFYAVAQAEGRPRRRHVCCHLLGRLFFAADATLHGQGLRNGSPGAPRVSSSSNQLSCFVPTAPPLEEAGDRRSSPPPFTTWVPRAGRPTWIAKDRGCNNQRFSAQRHERKDFQVPRDSRAGVVPWK